MVRRPTVAFILVLSALAPTGCGDEGAISTSIEASVNRGPGTRLTLAEHATFAWDKACIFGPYTPDATVDALTEVPGAAARAHDIRSNDAISTLIFLDQGRIAASVAHPRHRGDFGPDVIGRCYSRKDAVFLVRIPPSTSGGNIGAS